MSDSIFCKREASRPCVDSNGNGVTNETLKTWCKEFRLPYSNRNKAQLVAALKEFSNDRSRWQR